MKKFLHFRQRNNKGFLLLSMLVFSTIAIVTIGAFVSWSLTSSKLERKVQSRELALQIAEAGIEYSRWYLAHFQSGYTLGNSGAGPYVYNFKDKDGDTVGTYTITVTAPASGSTLVKIKSTGATLADPTATRSIQISLAIPSLAKYAVFANSDIRFGQGTVVYGPIHSNGGIRFDGVAWNKLTSAKTSYDDPDHTGGSEFGVHTHVNATTGAVDDTFRPLEAPPSTMQTRTDVFKAGRDFPVPAVDFTGITSDLSTIQTQAIASGRYIGPSTNGLGYAIIFKTDDTFDLYKINSLVGTSGQCTNSQNQSGWGSWTINSKTKLATYAFPTNGLIYVNDNLWVEGQINTARLTVVAATLPDNASTRRNIMINNNLTYTNYDGQDVIALIAQNNITTGLGSANDLRIDAALIAQNGRAGRFYYPSACSTGYVRNSLLLYGMIGTNQRYGFAYTDNTGYLTRTVTYDSNLLYSPPPNFPLASDKYQIISWEELEN